MKTTATVEEDEAKTIAVIDIGCMSNVADDPYAKKMVVTVMMVAMTMAM